MSTRERRKPADLRSRQWFDNPANPGMTAIYLERYLNYGLTRGELQSGKPVIGIAQTGSDLSPCNRHHLELAKRIRDGIIAAGGVPLEFPVHPIQETARRPTAALDRNLAYLGIVEVLHGYPIDGVVLLTGCDKTVPACLMAAATFNLPAISMNVGPMLNGWHEGKLSGSGAVVFASRERHAAGEIDYDAFMDIVASGTPSVGHCNTMGTASTMNALAEALGMSLPGSSAIPATYRERGQMAYATGRRIVELVWEDVRPSDILTREAFENAIVVASAIGGSTNAPIHVNALARHVGVPLDNDDWDRIGYPVPLLVDMQPAGRFLGEDYFRAGGLPAVAAALIEAGLLHEAAPTVSGRSIGENCRGKFIPGQEVIRRLDDPMGPHGGFVHFKGNLFDSAIMKVSAISDEFRGRYLSNPADPGAFEGRAVVFDGPEDYNATIDDPALGIDERSILVVRGAGPLGYPGAAEVVNMRPPAYLLRRGVHALPCIGDGRQSGTSGAPSILNASPEAAAGGGLALLCNGDPVRVDLGRRRVDVLIPDEELDARRAALDAAGGYAIPASQTPWQAIQRDLVGQLSDGMILKPAAEFRHIAQMSGVPRDNH